MKKKIPVIIIFLLFFINIYSGYLIKQDGVLFYIENNNYESVSLTATFNDWSDTTHIMEKVDGRWEIFIPLQTGNYQYKFVINNTDWILDPDNPSIVKDGNFENSYIEVVEVEKDEEIKSSENDIIKEETNENIIIFSYTNHEAESVSVVGDFNNWQPGKHELSDYDGDGVWTGEFFLDSGRYMYMFVVDEKYWYSDTEAEILKDDGYGGMNSFIEVNGQR
ncbi:MAG: glycogen-binding domain-containing protein [Candidatus Muiribacteriota bacterium]